jgi:hypothetical protein
MLAVWLDREVGIARFKRTCFFVVARRISVAATTSTSIAAHSWNGPASDPWRSTRFGFFARSLAVDRRY